MRTYRYLGSSDGGAAQAPEGMVVFGFGRGPGTRPLFRGAGTRISVGLIESAPVAEVHDHVARAVADARAGRRLAPPEAPALTVWHGPEQRFGHLGAPQRWINVLGNVAPFGQVQRLTGSLNGGAARTLSLGSDLHRLAAPGDFNLELSWTDLRPGTNRVSIHADFADGGALSTNVLLGVERGRSWPLPYGVNFAGAARLQDVVQVVDGRWQLVPEGVRTAHPWYDRVLAMGDRSWTNYEALVRLTVHRFIPSQPGPPTSR